MVYLLTFSKKFNICYFPYLPSNLCKNKEKHVTHKGLYKI